MALTTSVVRHRPAHLHIGYRASTVHSRCDQLHDADCMPPGLNAVDREEEPVALVRIVVAKKGAAQMSSVWR